MSGDRNGFRGISEKGGGGWVSGSSNARYTVADKVLCESHGQGKTTGALLSQE